MKISSTREFQCQSHQTFKGKKQHHINFPKIEEEGIFPNFFNKIHITHTKSAKDNTKQKRKLEHRHKIQLLNIQNISFEHTWKILTKYW